MSTFIKYFIHFFIITFFIIFILITLALTDGTIELNAKVLIYVLLIIVVFVVPMSLIFSSQAALVDVSVENDKEGKNIEIIKNIIEQDMKRTVQKEFNNKVIYLMKNRYYRWLTNEIIMNVLPENIVVSIPKAYKKTLQKKLNSKAF